MGRESSKCRVWGRVSHGGQRLCLHPLNRVKAGREASQQGRRLAGLVWEPSVLVGHPAVELRGGVCSARDGWVSRPGAVEGLRAERVHGKNKRRKQQRWEKPTGRRERRQRR